VFQPDREPRAYSNTQNQSKLAAFSLILVHEAIHLVHNLNLVEEEVICRTVQLLYFQDLIQGRSYASRVTGGGCNARLSANTGAVGTLMRSYGNMRRWHERAQLVDYVLRIPTYQQSLSAQFVRRSFRWWGGIGNRQPLTKGLYLRALAQDSQRADAGAMIAILKSFSSQAEWQAAGVRPEDYARLRLALIGPNSPSSPIAVEVESALRRSNNPTFARIMRQIGAPADRYPL
jgi:hypothetical protein